MIGGRRFDAPIPGPVDKNIAKFGKATNRSHDFVTFHKKCRGVSVYANLMHSVFTVMRSVSILGSTGSIGCNTLKVIEHLGDIRVVALGAGRNMPKLAEQILKFKPELVSVESGDC